MLCTLYELLKLNLISVVYILCCSPCKEIHVGYFPECAFLFALGRLHLFLDSHLALGNIRRNIHWALLLHILTCRMFLRTRYELTSSSLRAQWRYFSLVSESGIYVHLMIMVYPYNPNTDFYALCTMWISYSLNSHNPLCVPPDGYTSYGIQLDLLRTNPHKASEN